MTRYRLETRRMVLRPFTGADGGDLFELDADPEVMRWITGGRGTPREVIEGEILPRFMTYDGGGGAPAFWAAEDREDGAFLGWFTLRPVEEGDPSVVELGYRLRRAAWGRGLATEGARELIRHGFRERGVRRILATTYEDNLPSRRVLEKAGLKLVRRFRMTPEEIARFGSFEPATDEPWEHDDLEYALDREAWEG